MEILEIEIKDWLLIIFSFAVAISTIFYAFLTYKLVCESKRMRELQIEPLVVVKVEPEHTGWHGYEVVIKNEGQGPAKNVSFSFKGDATYFRNSFTMGGPPPINELPIIKDGLTYLGRKTNI